VKEFGAMSRRIFGVKTMRTIKDHIVENDSANHQLMIEVLDEPGAGGANHAYLISSVATSSGGTAWPIGFQNGTVLEKGVNGVTQEALLAVVIDRLRSFQAGKFSCRENAIALTHCEDALMWLQRRTRARIARGVEGTHTV
jgi:hypothetical protein